MPNAPLATNAATGKRKIRQKSGAVQCAFVARVYSVCDAYRSVCFEKIQYKSRVSGARGESA